MSVFDNSQYSSRLNARLTKDEQALLCILKEWLWVLLCEKHARTSEGRCAGSGDAGRDLKARVRTILYVARLGAR